MTERSLGCQGREQTGLVSEQAKEETEERSAAC